MKNLFKLRDRSNWTEYYISYGTIIGFSDLGVWYFTPRKYSSTTSRHTTLAKQDCLQAMIAGSEDWWYLMLNDVLGDLDIYDNQIEYYAYEWGKDSGFKRISKDSQNAIHIQRVLKNVLYS
jgi:hypothetical protein